MSIDDIKCPICKSLMIDPGYTKICNYFNLMICPHCNVTFIYYDCQLFTIEYNYNGFDAVVSPSQKTTVIYKEVSETNPFLGYSHMNHLYTFYKCLNYKQIYKYIDLKTFS